MRKHSALKQWQQRAPKRSRLHLAAAGLEAPPIEVVERINRLSKAQPHLLANDIAHALRIDVGIVREVLAP